MFDAHCAIPPAMLTDARIVSLINLLEHMPSPDEFVREIASHMSPDSFMVIEVPRHPSLSTLTSQLFPELAVRHIYPPDHLNIFSESSMSEMLGRIGFEITHIWLFGQDFFSFLITALADKSLSAAPYIKELLNASNDVQAAIDRDHLSDTMFLIARKAGP